MTTGPEAGYYADPSIPGYIRYWDGTQWVAGTSRPAPDLPQQAQAEPQFQGQQQVEQARARQQVQPQISAQGEWNPEPAVNTGQIAAMQQSVAAQLAEPALSHAQSQFTQTPPDYADETQQEAEVVREQTSVATMVVPSAFGSRSPYSMSGAASPFDAIPGLYRTNESDGAEAEPEVRVVELASAGSRILARIIDLCIAAVLSAPITITLILIAHRHDHAYVEQLRLQTKTTYRTLGLDATGIALWVAAVAVVILTAIIFDVARLPRTGQTTGRRVVGVQVVTVGTADGVPSGAAFLRALLFWLLAILPVIDVLTLGGVLWGRPYRQGLHEKLSRTLSIRA
ncbi:MAG: RDD family protein [Actinocrinis sp.]